MVVKSNNIGIKQKKRSSVSKQSSLLAVQLINPAYEERKRLMHEIFPLYKEAKARAMEEHKVAMATWMRETKTHTRLNIHNQEGQRIIAAYKRAVFRSSPPTVRPNC